MSDTTAPKSDQYPLPDDMYEAVKNERDEYLTQLNEVKK